MVPPCSDRISRVPPYSRTIVRITRTGLSPTMARLSRRFRLSCNCHWPDPRSLATTEGVSIDVLSSGYLDVSVPRVRFLTPIYSGSDTSFRNPLPKAGQKRPDNRKRVSEVGFPIRISTDQSLFAAPHGFSQRTTSFIACACQGIHRTLLRHLIVLIINARPKTPLQENVQNGGCPGQRTCRHCSAHDDPCEIGHGPERPV